MRGCSLLVLFPTVVAPLSGTLVSFDSALRMSIISKSLEFSEPKHLDKNWCSSRLLQNRPDNCTLILVLVMDREVCFAVFLFYVRTLPLTNHVALRKEFMTSFAFSSTQSTNCLLLRLKSPYLPANYRYMLFHICEFVNHYFCFSYHTDLL